MRDVSKRGGRGGPQKNIHKTFLVDKIDITDETYTDAELARVSVLILDTEE